VLAFVVRGVGNMILYEITYLESITLINVYPTLFTAIGGRDGMDASGAQWMTCAIYSTRRTSGLAFVVGGVGDML